MLREVDSDELAVRLVRTSCSATCSAAKEGSIEVEEWGERADLRGGKAETGVGVELRDGGASSLRCSVFLYDPFTETELW